MIQNSIPNSLKEEQQEYILKNGKIESKPKSLQHNEDHSKKSRKIQKHQKMKKKAKKKLETKFHPKRNNSCKMMK